MGAAEIRDRVLDDIIVGHAALRQIGLDADVVGRPGHVGDAGDGDVRQRKSEVIRWVERKGQRDPVIRESQFVCHARRKNVRLADQEVLEAIGLTGREPWQAKRSAADGRDLIGVEVARRQLRRSLTL